MGLSHPDGDAFRSSKLLARLGARVIPYSMKGWAPGCHRGIPDGHLVLLIHSAAPIGLTTPFENSGRIPVSLSGIREGPVALWHSGGEEGVQVDLPFRLVRALWGAPAAFVNRVVSLADIDASLGNQLLDAVMGEPEPIRRREAVSGVLAGRLGDLSPPSLMERAWDRLYQEGGNLRIAELAREFSVSRRYLSRLFGDEVGVAPKVIARLFRVMTSRTKLMSALRPGITSIALEAGFSDHSHMIAQWKRVAGLTPRQWLCEEFPFLQDTALMSRGESDRDGNAS